MELLELGSIANGTPIFAQDPEIEVIHDRRCYDKWRLFVYAYNNYGGKLIVLPAVALLVAGGSCLKSPNKTTCTSPNGSEERAAGRLLWSTTDSNSTMVAQQSTSIMDTC